MFGLNHISSFYPRRLFFLPFAPKQNRTQKVLQWQTGTHTRSLHFDSDSMSSEPAQSIGSPLARKPSEMDTELKLIWTDLIRQNNS